MLFVIVHVVDPYSSTRTVVLRKSTNTSVALRSFSRTFSMIRQIVRICDVVDLFPRKPFCFFLRISVDFRFDTIEKQSIIYLSSQRSKNHASVILGDSVVTFLREGVDEAFCLPLYCILFTYGVAKSENCHCISLSSILP